EFVDLMYVRHDARARETGARLLHACGFDSVPPRKGSSSRTRMPPRCGAAGAVRELPQAQCLEEAELRVPAP
ncbi:hypothetical protein AB0L81_29755, partial [Streptomyces sp. NPDC052127]